VHLLLRKMAPCRLRKGREIRGFHVGCTRDGTVYLIHGIRVMHFAVSTSTKFKHRCEATCPGVRA
jgi:hypothetical protein